ncbi:MAG: hypothetical protein ACK53Y_08820, partial [bacterium]
MQRSITFASLVRSPAAAASSSLFSAPRNSSKKSFSPWFVTCPLSPQHGFRAYRGIGTSITSFAPPPCSRRESI